MAFLFPGGSGASRPPSVDAITKEDTTGSACATAQFIQCAICKLLLRKGATAELSWYMNNSPRDSPIEDIGKQTATPRFRSANSQLHGHDANTQRQSLISLWNKKVVVRLSIRHWADN